MFDYSSCEMRLPYVTKDAVADVTRSGAGLVAGGFPAKHILRHLIGVSAVELGHTLLTEQWHSALAFSDYWPALL